MGIPWFEKMDASGETPMTRVQKCGYREIALLMITHERLDEDDQTEELPELVKAAYWGKKEEIARLLNAGSDPHVRGESGDTPLHLAARNGHKDIIETLLDHGSDVNEVNNKGLTSLHWVAMNGRVDIAALLLAHGADINARDKLTKKLTPTAIALLLGYDDLAVMLSENGGTC